MKKNADCKIGSEFQNLKKKNYVILGSGQLALGLDCHIPVEVGLIQKDSEMFQNGSDINSIGFHSDHCLAYTNGFVTLSSLRDKSDNGRRPV